MRRVLILTGAENKQKHVSDPENKIEEMFNLTLPSKQRYVKRHGYDLMVLRSFGVDLNNKLQRNDDHMGFLRVLRVIEQLQYYDVVMWIDGDSIITNEEYVIENFELEPNYTFYASWDWMHKTPYSNGIYNHAFSLGNFIIQKTEHLNYFAEIFYSISKHFPDEQYALNSLYAKTELKKTIKILDHKYLGGVPEFVQDLKVWNNRSKLIEPWNETHFLSHFTGISNEERIEMMNTKFKKYL